MAEDLTQYLRAFKGILSTTKQYSHVLNRDLLEFCSFFVAQDELNYFYVNKENDGNFKLAARGASKNPSLEDLAKFAISNKITPKSLINSFCNSLSKPLAKYMADAESNRLENQLLYQLELNREL